jgi:DNA-binding HxlR family transcriptional regulator
MFHTKAHASVIAQDGTILIPGMLEVTDSMLANAEVCPIRNVLDEVGNKWSLLVMLSLAGKRRRFMDVKRSIGDITQRVLTQTLRKLERDGYVARQVYPTSPPTVEYWLTPLGVSLLEPTGRLVIWANENFDRVMKSRRKYDEARPTTVTGGRSSNWH